jgi:hypothetical protein
MVVFIGKVNNYMLRPKAAIFRLSQLPFCSKSVIYIYIFSLSRDQSDDDDDEDDDDHVWSKHVADLWPEYVVML